MVKVRDAFLNTEDFNFQITHQGIVQLSFGPTHICMNLDSVYDLQYRLASFLAYLELKEYPQGSQSDEIDLRESKEALEKLAYRKTFPMDA